MKHNNMQIQKLGNTSPRRKLTKARTTDAKIPAKVPSTLTAPSVPLGTTLNVVTRYLDIKQEELCT
jgi:hypothetical protein